MANGSIDEDGDAISYRYSWSKNGVLTSYTTPQVPASATQKEEQWTVRVTPNDGHADGQHSEESVLIENSSPVVSSLFVSPGSPTTSDLLRCSAVVSDADGEPLTENYIWKNMTRV